jgi:protein-tyrosine-phosphatase
MLVKTGLIVFDEVLKDFVLHSLNKVMDWRIEDPKDKPIEKVREIRDEIEGKVKKLIEEMN